MLGHIKSIFFILATLFLVGAEKAAAGILLPNVQINVHQPHGYQRRVQGSVNRTRVSTAAARITNPLNGGANRLSSNSHENALLKAIDDQKRYEQQLVQWRARVATHDAQQFQRKQARAQQEAKNRQRSQNYRYQNFGASGETPGIIAKYSRRGQAEFGDTRPLTLKAETGTKRPSFWQRLKSALFH